jgi:hypothetical protein
MPALYNKLGISFQYPDNWRLDEEDALAGRQSVTVYSPGGAFWSVTLQLPAVDPQESAKTVADALRQEYEGAEVEPTAETVAGFDLVGYDLHFFYLDLISTVQIRSLRIAETTFTIVIEAEDQELAQLGRVMEAITVSLLTALGGSRHSRGL